MTRRHPPSRCQICGLPSRLPLCLQCWRWNRALNCLAGARRLLAALPHLDKALSGLDAKPINLIHDELVLYVATADVDYTDAVLVDAMTTGFAAIFPEAEAVGTLRDLVEAHDGPNWAAAKG